MTAKGSPIMAKVILIGEKSRSAYSIFAARWPGLIRDAMDEYAGIKYPKRWHTSIHASICVSQSPEHSRQMAACHCLLKEGDLLTHRILCLSRDLRSPGASPNCRGSLIWNGS